MLINKLQRNLKKQLISRHTFLALASCVLLFVCGVLSQNASAQQQTMNTEPRNTANDSVNKLALKNDPTRPPSVIVQQLKQALEVAPEYELTAIFTRDKQQYAVVNGNVVKAGDPIANMLVTNITGTNLTMKNAASSEDTMVLELSGAVSIKTQVTK